MSTEAARRRLRVNAAEALNGVATKTDLLADLIAAARSVSTPGPREIADAVELSQLWDDIEGDFAMPPDLTDQGPPARV